MIINEIKTLREELFSLIELQKSISGDIQNNDRSSFLTTNNQENIENLMENSDRHLHIETDPNSIEPKNITQNISNQNSTVINNLNNLNNNVTLNNSSNTPKSNKNSIHTANTNSQNGQNFLQNECLPNIEQFFVFKNKISLVDSEKNLWHLKKCKKFEEFTKKNAHSYKNKEDNLFAFLEYYQNNEVGNEAAINIDYGNSEVGKDDPEEINIDEIDLEEEPDAIGRVEEREKTDELEINKHEKDNELKIENNVAATQDLDNSLNISDSD